jgi:hypothetical protein
VAWRAAGGFEGANPAGDEREPMNSRSLGLVVATLFVFGLAALASVQIRSSRARGARSAGVPQDPPDPTLAASIQPGANLQVVKLPSARAVRSAPQELEEDTKDTHADSHVAEPGNQAADSTPLSDSGSVGTTRRGPELRVEHVKVVQEVPSVPFPPPNTLPRGAYPIGTQHWHADDIHAPDTTLIFDGPNQTVSGKVRAKKVIVRGTTRLVDGAELSTLNTQVAEPGEAQLVIEAGATLVIGEGAVWTTPNPYGYRVEGALVVDGGVFQCRFANGNGTTRGEDSWAPGSSLTVWSGQFRGSGDHSFAGAELAIHGGAVEIDDDIWSTGESLVMTGGRFRNSPGMFRVTGSVNIRGGTIQASQSGDRGLRFHKAARVVATGGQIEIRGGAATSARSGIHLGGGTVWLNKVLVTTSTTIHETSDPDAVLSIADLFIAPDQRFDARGFQVLTHYMPGPEDGVFQR